ncbi:hypothetical protein CDL12_26476 [Handroanthus impetiginosus]|uniref:Uncharacterized protein n=1 Tax=Handroanthus impetiginosus TaxID=429701 RepID=A0A2G9G6T8_9LAMI|nr:hypothetical protein CDL12_26476 [Handroanthus impetiginosus]
MTEFMPENDVIIAKNVKETVTDPAAVYTHGAAGAKPPVNVETKKKKRGAFGIFSAALFMLRKRPGEKGAKKSITNQNSTASNANWTKLVGSMRPLCLQETPQSPTAAAAAQTPQPADETTKEIIQLQKQPSAAESIEEMISPASPFSTSSSGTMSQYASAASLQDLYNCSDDEDEDPDEVFDAITGDEMIDAKAEEFIAQFYKQIQLQNSAAYYHHRDRGI